MEKPCSARLPILFPMTDSPHRDALTAAHERIASLEADADDRRRIDADATRLAALLRERARASSEMAPQSVWGRLPWFFVVFGVAALAFAHDGDWIIAFLAVLSPFAIGLGARAIARSNRRSAVAQVKLIDEEIARLQTSATADRGANVTSHID